MRVFPFSIVIFQYGTAITIGAATLASIDLYPVSHRERRNTARSVIVPPRSKLRSAVTSAVPLTLMVFVAVGLLALRFWLAFHVV